MGDSVIICPHNDITAAAYKNISPTYLALCVSEHISNQCVECCIIGSRLGMLNAEKRLCDLIANEKSSAIRDRGIQAGIPKGLLGNRGKQQL